MSDYDTLKAVTRKAMLTRALNSKEAQNVGADSPSFYMYIYAEMQIDKILYDLHTLPEGRELIGRISKDETLIAWNADEAKERMLYTIKPL